MKWPFVLTLTWFQLYSLWYSYQPPESVGGFFTWLFLTLYIIVLNLKSQHAILKSNLLVAPFFDVPMRIHWCLNFFSEIQRHELSCVGNLMQKKKSPFVEEYYRRLWIWWWCDYLYWNTIISYKTPLLH